MELFTLPSCDKKSTLHGVLWLPQGDARGIVQIAHGMIEYVERYDAFARALTAQGFIVLGHDHIGHGDSVANASDRGHLGDEDGFSSLIGDIGVVRAYAQSRFASLPYFLLGHSMGSYAVRHYITRHADGLHGALILGTGNQGKGLLHAGHFLASCFAKIFGATHRSRLLHYLALGSLNRPFAKEGENAFLTRDVDIVRAYNNEPRCTFYFTDASYRSMFSAMLDLHDAARLAQIPKTLPLLVASGACDPLGRMGKDVQRLALTYRSLGIQDVTLTLYDNDRHELLNELDRETVYADIARWLNAHLSGQEDA